MADRTFVGVKQLLLNRVFLVAAIVYVVLFAFKRMGMYLGWISNYLADFLCMPVVLTLALVLMQYMFTPGRISRLSIWQVALGVVYFGLMFEWFLPGHSSRFTADWVDSLMYVLGALVFYFWINPPKEN